MRYNQHDQQLSGDTAPPLRTPQTCSLGESPLTLISSSIWQNGPTWLTTPDKWPLFDQPPLPQLIVVAAVATEFVPADPATSTLGLHCVILLNRYSTLCKLLRVTAYVFCFIDNVQTQPDHRCYGPVSAKEFVTMRLKWVRDTQQTVYIREITNLQLVSKHPKTTRALLV